MLARSTCILPALLPPLPGARLSAVFPDSMVPFPNGSLNGF
jgi:hypothetical protein